MGTKQIKAAIEAVLFASGEPTALDRLTETLEMDAETVERLADELMQEINARVGGVMMVKLEDSYQLCTRKEYADYVRKAMALHRNVPLSQAAMEVLSIVAYNQPVTRAFIDQVRGVDCGAVMQGLIAKSLIEEKGRLELPGRPLLYGTTLHFLRCFGLESLTDLPPLPQKEEAEDEPVQITVDDTLQDAEIEASEG